MSRTFLITSLLLVVAGCDSDEENPSSTATDPTVEFDYTQPEIDTGWPEDTGLDAPAIAWI